ncbi:MAG: hypothetical protein JSS69_10220 [Acidobacteria bacterium]|nr:hypothetical protein [Acidobacteriota bacterium]MBS1866279.1 hypothetical protein [Acidobacteriota bacterium]
MKTTPSLIALCVFALMPVSTEKITVQDAVRVREFYRLADRIQDQIWHDWSKIPAPLLLVTPQAEYLTHLEKMPEGFADAGDGFFVRPRQFSTNFEATFPAFGPPDVIVAGEPQNTASKTSVPWLMVLMHEHFHQLQGAQPDLYKKIEELGLSHGDETGMWMLTFPFPYEKPEVTASFAAMRDSLLAALAESDDKKFKLLAAEYSKKRKSFFMLLAPEDRKYFNFQLWKEGIARYTQIKSAEAAANYEPSAEFAGLADYESFASVGEKARAATLSELKQIKLAEAKRTAVYSFGAAEGLLLDRLRPDWKKQYFERPLTLEGFFEN